MDYSNLENSEKITTSIVENDLTAFKKYLDDPNSDIQLYLGENGVIYTYDVAFSVYAHDADGNFVDSGAEADGTNGAGSFISSGGILNRLQSSPALTGGSSTGAANFSELMAGNNGQIISPVITDNYDVLYGAWPEKYNEVILVVDDENSISVDVLYQLGMITKVQYDDAVEKIENGEAAEPIDFDFAELCGHTFYLVAACDHYTENEDGTFTYLELTEVNEEKLLENALELTITGIICPKEDAENASITTAVGYTSALTDHIITHTDESAVILAQEETPDINVLNGMKFESPDDAAKIADAKKYLSNLSVSEKASFYQLMMYYSSTKTEGGATQTTQPGMSTGAMGPGAAMDENTMAAMLDQWLAGEPSEELLLKVYDEYIAGSTYEENMTAFGKVSYDAPASISIYTDNFENKDRIAECITAYNESVSEDERITYTDYVAMLTSSLTLIIDGISWLLIGFVSIALVVSCIMIGIITHISVMERTKEIGILRALGASKANISQVFNAETFIIGCCSGLLGIGVSLLALEPINALIEHLTNIPNLDAQLPATSSVLLIALSIVITIIGGLLPAKKAAKKDPVIALRTE